MSSISGTQSGGLLQFLQRLSPSGSSSSSSSSSTDTSAASAITGHHHHKHGGGGGFAKLADAVTSALQSASNSSSGTTTNANDTITAALTKIFKNGSLGGPTTDPDSDTDPTGTASDSDSVSTTSTTGLPASFAATLQSFGVTPAQFQKDLASALQSAQQTGTADTSAAFKSFPAGSIVDTIG